jgi:hypothetical protein
MKRGILKAALPEVWTRKGDPIETKPEGSFVSGNQLRSANGKFLARLVNGLIYWPPRDK